MSPISNIFKQFYALLKMSTKLEITNCFTKINHMPKYFFLAQTCANILITILRIKQNYYV